MSQRFDKDAWIRSALKRRYLIVSRDGSILRSRAASKDGLHVSAEYNPVTVRIHKPTGRVYFNMTWLGFTKSVLVNRVVAWAFLPNPLNLPQVNHKNGDKEDNSVENLEWASGSDNERHAHRTGLKTGRGSQNSNAKLTAAEVLEIRASTARPAEIAEKYGVARSTIMNIINRKTWEHV